MTNKKAIEIVYKMTPDHEGVRTHPYKDTAVPPRTTIGIGRNLTDKGLSHDEIMYLFGNDVKETRVFLEGKPYWNTLSPVRQAVLIDMAFCLGPKGFNKFVGLNRELLAGNYTAAAKHIAGSKFARQTGRRAVRLEIMMRTDTVPKELLN